MADVDKSLPNVRNSVTVPSDEEQIEVQTEIQESIPSSENSEIIENEDGSVDINFEPGAEAPEAGDQHYSNLAVLLPDSILTPLGSELHGNFTDYKASRKEWEDTYTKGLDLLGFKYENRTEPFQGAVGATHPVLSRSCYTVSSTSLQRIITCRWTC